MGKTTLTGCTHYENPDIRQEYVCGHCEDDRDAELAKLQSQLDAIEEKCRELRDDWAPDHVPHDIGVLLEEIEELI